MECLADLRPVERPEDDSRIELLLADADAGLRALLATRAIAAVAALRVLEAEDGAEAVRIGLQRRPQFALLDVNMPRLGGIEVAITLRELRPEMRIALHSGEPDAHRERAHEHRLLLFDKLHIERSIRWLGLQVQVPAQPARSLECSACGYGVVRSTAPERCPMCQMEGSWLDGRRRSPGRLAAEGW